MRPFFLLSITLGVLTVLGLRGEKAPWQVDPRLPGVLAAGLLLFLYVCWSEARRYAEFWGMSFGRWFVAFGLGFLAGAVAAWLLT